jgi:hypothetical protein
MYCSIQISDDVFCPDVFQLKLQTTALQEELQRFKLGSDSSGTFQYFPVLKIL